MYKRTLELKSLLKQKSLFLLGPRQTGKSTLLQAEFPKAKYINLLEADVFREFSSHPEALRQSLKSSDKVILIDEIQKVPALLDEVHSMIEKDKLRRFLLTGSSARRIRKNGANLLAGRVWFYNLHPLTTHEIGSKEGDILRMLNVGGIPSIFDSLVPQKDLSSYVGTYLKEEIYAESVVRSFERFSRFLDVSGFCNGQIVNFTKVGNDSGIPPRTVIEYFKILEDTLLGFLLEPLTTAGKRKSVSSSKFYFFDLGVANFLLGRNQIRKNTENFGAALEHLVFRELMSLKGYRCQDAKLNYWRSLSQFEVDFVWNEKFGIEVKASTRIHSSDEKGLHALAQDVPGLKKIIVCNEPRFRKTDSGVLIFPFQEFFKEIWTGGLLGTT